MIDLHTHTTASDGRCTPAELVTRAAAAGVTILSVTDHDTVAGCGDAAEACAAAGIEFVAGIEVTAVRERADVHVLGYFIDTRSAALHDFLSEQRRRRVDRVREMIHRLAAAGIHLDADAVVQPAIDNPARSAGRPWIARALVAGGFVRDSNEAFGRWLARGRPAYVPRAAASPDEVFERIHDAGGVASLAHPGLNDRDEWIESFAAGRADSATGRARSAWGLDALEAYHTEHDEAATARYLEMAKRLGLAVTGGSDYHADHAHGAAGPGSVSLPREAFDDLRRRATRRATASGDGTSS